MANLHTVSCHSAVIISIIIFISLTYSRHSRNVSRNNPNSRKLVSLSLFRTQAVLLPRTKQPICAHLVSRNSHVGTAEDPGHRIPRPKVLSIQQDRPHDLRVSTQTQTAKSPRLATFYLAEKDKVTPITVPSQHCFPAEMHPDTPGRFLKQRPLHSSGAPAGPGADVLCPSGGSS